MSPPPICPPSRSSILVATDGELRRAVLHDARRSPQHVMAVLVWDDLNRGCQSASNCVDGADQPTPTAPASPPTRPGLPAPGPLITSILEPQKGATHDG
jgi:hypothetical protein